MMNTMLGGRAGDWAIAAEPASGAAAAEASKSRRLVGGMSVVPPVM